MTPDPKTAYSHREVLSCCVHHPSLPRWLPAPPLLMFDRITETHTAGGKHDTGWIVAEEDVRFDEWFFFSHFEGDPVMPGVLEVDAFLQLSGFFPMHAGHAGYGRALRTGRIVFREQVRPHHTLVTYAIDVKEHTGQPTPLVFAESVTDVDDQVSAEVEGIMLGLFQDLSYAYP